MKTRFFPLVLMALLATLTACNLPLNPETWYVATTGDNSNNCDSPETACRTIQAAIGKAENADTIIIAEGSYEENIIINKTLVLRGAGPEATSMDGRGIPGTVIHVSGNHLVTLEGMTITNGNDAPGVGGIYNQGSTLAIVNTIVTGNIGIGIYTRDGGLVITDSTISNNSPTGGVRGYGGAINITNSTITDNQSANPGGGIFIGEGGSLTVSDSVISGNMGHHGGGIFVSGECAEVSINNSMIEDNIASGDGGGIGNTGCPSMTITNTFISRNAAAWGGGIAVNHGNLTLSNSTIADNNAPSGGGIVFATFRDAGCGAALISNSVISGNTANDIGGGIYLRRLIQGQCTMIVTNTTISGNTTAGAGGGISNVGGDLTISNSTITENTASGAGDGLSGGGLITNTILANNGQVNCSGEVISMGHNLDSGDTCGFNAPADLTNTDPLLGPLADNGGGTLTHALMPDSPALDGGDHPNCPAADQRGVARPQGAACDIGAFESEEFGAELLPGMPLPIMPTATTTLTPTLGAPTATATQDGNCRLGPSTAYAATNSLLTGQSAPIVGRNADSSWWVINNGGSECWIWGEIVTVTGDTSQVPVKTPPPLPTATFTQPAPLTAPSPISPNGTLNCADVTGGVTLSWSAVSHTNGIDHYEWALEGGLNNSGSTSSTQTVISPINCGASYQWRVRAVDGKGNIGPWSTYMQFNVQ